MRKIIVILTVTVSLMSGCNINNEAALNKRLSNTPEQMNRSRIEQRIAANFEDSQAHYQLGKLYMTDRLLSKAEYEFNLAISFDPVNRDAQAAHVKVYQVMGNKEKSAQLADIYMRQVSARAEDGLLLGRAFQNEGLEDYAMVCYEKALSLAPNSAVLNKQIGFYYLNKGDEVRAEGYLKRSIQADPYQSDVAGELGKMGVRVEVPRKQTSGSSIDNLFKKTNEQEK